MKLTAQASVNPATGRVTTEFRENPQLPFSKLVLRLKGGGTRPAREPADLRGRDDDERDLAPWSAPITPDGTPFNTFTRRLGRQRRRMPRDAPVRPGLSPPAPQPAAGAFAPFTVTISRRTVNRTFAGRGQRPPAGCWGPRVRPALR